MARAKRSTGKADVIGSHAVMLWGLYKRLRALGCPQCPVCRDYVLTIQGHACERLASPTSTQEAA